MPAVGPLSPAVGRSSSNSPLRTVRLSGSLQGWVYLYVEKRVNPRVILESPFHSCLWYLKALPIALRSHSIHFCNQLTADTLERIAVKQKTTNSMCLVSTKILRPNFLTKKCSHSARFQPLVAWMAALMAASGKPVTTCSTQKSAT